jgi:hypothetical protein
MDSSESEHWEDEDWDARIDEEYQELVEEYQEEEEAEEAGEAEEEETEDTLYKVDSATMLDMKRFYDMDRDIQICRERKMAETGRSECTIGWWFRDEVELARLPLLNSLPYKRQIERMQWQAQDYLNLFRFVCFYYVKDVAKWMKKESGDLPFGLVELGVQRGDMPGEFILRRKAGSFKSDLEFRCTDKKMAACHDFYIYEEGAKFQRLRETTEGCDKGADIAPLSPFMSLYEEKRAVVEAKVCLMDANFIATHPEPFLYSKLLPDAGLEEMPEEVRYALDDVDPARQAGNIRRMNVATVAAENYISRMNSKRKRGGMSADCTEQWEAFRDDEGDEDDGMTIFEERQKEFGRPSLKKTLKPLPASMQITRGPVPTVLVKPEEMQRVYEDMVCNLMNFPHLFFKPHTSLGMGKVSLTPSELTFSQRQLEDSVARQQRTFQHLFETLYERTYGRLDAIRFGQMGPEAEHITREVRTRMKFRNHAVVSEDALKALLPFLTAGVITAGELRPLLARKYDLGEEKRVTTSTITTVVTT